MQKFIQAAKEYFATFKPGSITGIEAHAVQVSALVLALQAQVNDLESKVLALSQSATARMVPTATGTGTPGTSQTPVVL